MSIKATKLLKKAQNVVAIKDNLGQKKGCANIDFGLRSYFLQINLWVVVTSIHKKGFRYIPSRVLSVVQFKGIVHNFFIFGQI